MKSLCSGIVCWLVLCFSGAVDATEQTRAREQQKKEVTVSDAGEISMRYSFSFRLSDYSSQQVLLPLPAESDVVQLTAVWGTMKCPDREIIGVRSREGLSFPEVCQHAEVEYGFTALTEVYGFNDVFADIFFVGQADSVSEKQYVLQFQSARDIYWRLHGDVPVFGAPKSAQEHGRVFYWLLGSAPIKNSEMPLLEISTVSSWELIGRRFAELWQLQCENFDIPDPASLGIVATTMEGLLDGWQQYVQKKFSYQENKMKQHYRMPATCQEIWQRQYGDCKDITLLSVTILKGWGLKVFPVLVATGKKNTEEYLPNPMLFDHAVIGREDKKMLQFRDMWREHQWSENSPGFILRIN
jgi:hypothetical protein